MENSWKPNRKVGVGAGVGGPIAVILPWALDAFFGIKMPPEIAGAVAILVGFGLAYLVPEKKAK